VSSRETIEHWLHRLIRTYEEAPVPHHEAGRHAKAICALRIFLGDHMDDELQLKRVQCALEELEPLAMDPFQFRASVDKYIADRGDACRQFIAQGTCETLLAYWATIDPSGKAAYLVLPESVWARALLKTMGLFFPCVNHAPCPGEFEDSALWILPSSIASTLTNAPATRRKFLHASREGRVREIPSPPSSPLGAIFNRLL
jgi:hypothetical protein